MSQETSPTVWRRWIAFEMRRLRADAEMSQAEAARQCGWSAPRISYIENAQRGVSVDDVERLLSLYEVPTDRWAPYLQAVEDSRGKGWWQRFDERVVPPWLSLFVGLEQGASEIRAYEALVVPGLLQTAAYAEAVVRADVVPQTEQQVRDLAGIRTARQRVLDREPSPLRLWAVVDEAALHRVADSPAVMADQLDHLASMAQRPNVTIQVVPFVTGVNPYSFGAFRVLGFPWEGDAGVVYTEHRDGAVFLEESHEVQAHVLVFQHLVTLALSPDETIATLRERAARLRP
jgi:transcriptional regulator with XRE-family HTH domain